MWLALSVVRTAEWPAQDTCHEQSATERAAVLCSMKGLNQKWSKQKSQMRTDLAERSKLGRLAPLAQALRKPNQGVDVRAGLRLQVAQQV